MKPVFKQKAAKLSSKRKPIVKFNSDRKVIKTYASLQMLMKEILNAKEGFVMKRLREGYVNGEFTYQYKEVFIFESKFD